MMDKIDEILKTSSHSSALYELVEYYKNASADERQAIRNSWVCRQDKRLIFPNFRKLACCRGDARTPAERIEAILVYTAIEDGKGEGDIRDVLISLCLLYHSAVEAGLDPYAMFESVARISSKEMARTLREFVHRSPENKSLAAFGWKKTLDAFGEPSFESVPIPPQTE